MNPYFSKKTTNVLKGIALILMFCNHFFTYPDWWVNEDLFPWWKRNFYLFSEPFMTCVAIFAFITGYLFFFGDKKNYLYSFKKIGLLYLSYWIVYLMLIILAVCTKTHYYSSSEIIWELLGFNRQTMLFCWYILFYAATMLILPLSASIPTKKWYIDLFLATIIAPFIFRKIGNIVYYFRPNLYFSEIISYLEKWYPVILSGMICAKYNVFENVLDPLFSRIKTPYLKGIISIPICTFFVLCKRPFPYIDVSMGKIPFINAEIHFGIIMDFFYAPIVVYCLIQIITTLNLSNATNILEIVGKYSMYSWFISCIFFNVSKEVFQKFLYWPKNSFLVLIWGVALCTTLSIPISFIIDKIKVFANKIINKIITTE